MKIAVCQMDSQNDKWQNLQQAAKLIEKNAREGADLIAFPETMNFMGKGYRYQAESIPGETTEFLCEQARKHHVWLVSGSFPEKTEEEKPKNTLVLISPEGEICCKYSKLHMFDIDAGGKVIVNLREIWPEMRSSWRIPHLAESDLLSAMIFVLEKCFV